MAPLDTWSTKPSALEIQRVLNSLHLGFLQSSTEFILKFMNHYDFIMQRRLLSHDRMTESKQDMLFQKASGTQQSLKGMLPAVLGGNTKQDVFIFSKYCAECACGSRDTQVI